LHGKKSLRRRRTGKVAGLQVSRGEVKSAQVARQKGGLGAPVLAFLESLGGALSDLAESFQGVFTSPRDTAEIASPLIFDLKKMKHLAIDKSIEIEATEDTLL